MIELFTIVCHIGITLLTVAAIAVRIEHRLTRIETDLSWLKNNQKCEDKCVRQDKQDNPVNPVNY